MYESLEYKAVKTWTAKAANGCTLEITLKKGVYTYRVNRVELGLIDLSRLLTGTVDETFTGIFDTEAIFQAAPDRVATFKWGSAYHPDEYQDPALALVERANKVYNYFWEA